jgi:hypothetical protein
MRIGRSIAIDGSDGDLGAERIDGTIALRGKVDPTLIRGLRTASSLRVPRRLLEAALAHLLHEQRVAHALLAHPARADHG